jgi:3-methyladenine DNA glycosylase/8-oxoguanine DNA glycosylase
VLTRDVEVQGPLHLRRTLGKLQRGAADPTMRVSAREVTRATRTPQGPATMHLEMTSDTRAFVEAWGEGASWLLDSVDDLLGARDDAPPPSSFEGKVGELARQCAGLRLSRTNRVFELLVPIVLEQLVTGKESKRAYRNLVREYSEPAPGPYDELMLPPSPKAVARVPADEWLYLGILRKQGETLRRLAQKAHRMEEAADMTHDDAERRLLAIAGIGPWTAGLAMVSGMGHADAIPVGDYHLPNTVAWNLAGEDRADDERMLELLEPYRGQRGRVTRYIEMAGEGAPRYGPRRTIRDIPGRDRYGRRRRS